MNEPTMAEATTALGEMGAEAPAEAVPPAEEAAPETPPAETPPEEGAPQGDERTRFTPEQQRVFDERLGREVAKRKSIEEERDSAQVKLAEAEQNLTEQAAQVAAALRLDPSYLKPEERSLVMRANELEQREEELELLELNPGDKEPEQVRKDLISVRRELRHIADRANAVYDRAKQQMIADLAEGRKSRTARERASASAGAPAPLRAPVGSPIRTPTAPPATRPESHGMNATRFRKAGATLQAAEDELSRL